MRNKVTVVGSGNVGASVALRLSDREIADVVMTDILEGIPQGKGLDILEAGPVVGSDSRGHPFVDESLAQFSAMLYFEDRYDVARAETEGQRQVAMNFHVMRLEGHADAPVDRAASAFAAPMDYAGLVYGKGPFLYPALRQELGDDAFFAGLREYVTTYRMRTAGPRSLTDVLARGPHASRVRALTHRWLEERHGDDDLGPSTPDTLIAGMLPPEMANDPAMRAMLGPMIQAMLGGGGGGGIEDMLGGGEEITPEQQRALEQLMQEMTGGGEE